MVRVENFIDLWRLVGLLWVTRTGDLDEVSPHGDIECAGEGPVEGAKMIDGQDMGAKEAIAVSIRENRIVRIEDPTGSQSIVLDELAEDSVRNGEEIELWGVRESDGSAWRVHVPRS